MYCTKWHQIVYSMNYCESVLYNNVSNAQFKQYNFEQCKQLWWYGTFVTKFVRYRKIFLDRPKIAGNCCAEWILAMLLHCSAFLPCCRQESAATLLSLSARYLHCTSLSSQLLTALAWTLPTHITICAFFYISANVYIQSGPSAASGASPASPASPASIIIIIIITFLQSSREMVLLGTSLYRSGSMELQPRFLVVGFFPYQNSRLLQQHLAVALLIYNLTTQSTKNLVCIIPHSSFRFGSLNAAV